MLFFGSFSSFTIGGGAGLKLQSSSSKGAILSLPGGATRTDIETLDLFSEYAEKNVESWFRYFNQQRRWGIDSLYFVTGHDSCHSCGVAASSSSSGEHGISLTFTATPIGQIDGSYKCEWQKSPFATSRVSSATEWEGRNQTVFLRGFTISNRRSLRRFGRRSSIAVHDFHDFIKQKDPPRHRRSYGSMASPDSSTGAGSRNSSLGSNSSASTSRSSLFEDSDDELSSVCLFRFPYPHSIP